jgi:glycerophosphoryl diester phosphodiesterase
VRSALPGVPDDMERAQRELPLIYEEWAIVSADNLRKSDGGPGGLQLMGHVEVKVDQNAAQNREFIDGIRSNGLSDRTVVTSTDLDRLAEIEKLAPDLPRMLFVGEKVPVSQLVDEKLWAVAVNDEIASKGYVTELKKAGLVVVVWTVNEEQAWEKARSAGADKVLTDKPKAYAAWLDKQ